MQKENISVRLEPKTIEQVEAIAALMDRDRSYVLNEAVNAYIRHYQWQAEQIKQALKEADAGDFASITEMEALDAKYHP